jgi:methyl-accepting chemotaxis protein
MKSIQTRLYTNAVLTAIAILLAVLAFRTSFTSDAAAQLQFQDLRGEQRNQEQINRYGDQSSQFKEFAAATREVAKANENIAKAITESAKAQNEIAKAIGRLASQLELPELAAFFQPKPDAEPDRDQ